MKITIGKRITVGFTVTVLITLALGAFTYMKIAEIQRASAVITGQALPGLKGILRLKAEQRANLAHVFETIIETDPAKLAIIYKRIDVVHADIGKIAEDYASGITTDEERKLYENFKANRAVWSRLRQKIAALVVANKNAEAYALFQSEGRAAFGAVEKAMQDIYDFNNNGADDATISLNAATKSSVTGLMIGVGAAFLTSTALGIFIIRSVSAALGRMADSLGDGSNQVAAAASQVSSSSQMLAQGASEQAASLEETSSALEEMSSMTKKNAESAHQANTLSSDAKTSADKGNLAMQKMTTAINDIQKSATETAKIVKVIDEIAFQTNLLALNAAVEAARAGEAGKGFAVVAEEVRNLAMRSAEAAKNTSAMIEQSVQNSRNGVAIAGDVGKVLEEITVSSGKVSALIGEIAAASQEQSQGIGQVNTAVSQMDKVTQTNAAAAEESASASEELASQASQMSGVVHELMLLVGRQSHAAKPIAKANPKPKPRVLTPARPGVQSAKAKAHAEFPLEDDAAGNNDFSDFNVSKAA